MSVGIFTTIFHRKIPEKYHISWLNMLIWGGSAGLALEHVAHREIIGSFPFLTAVQNGETMAMLAEMGTIGGAMLAACVGIWAVMVWFANHHVADAGAKTAAQ
jgi:hypothetical protein